MPSLALVGDCGRLAQTELCVYRDLGLARNSFHVDACCSYVVGCIFIVPYVFYVFICFLYVFMFYVFVPTTLVVAGLLNLQH